MEQKLVDEISSEPKPFWPWLARLSAVVLTAALIAAVSAAFHYRDDVSAIRRKIRSASSPVPRLSSTAAALPSARGLSGSVTAFAVRSSSGQVRVLVTAEITGGLPHTRYSLYGGDCASTVPDHNWATGITNAAGTAGLAGPAWSIVPSHLYYLALSTPGHLDHPSPAIHGHLGIAGGLTPVHGGIAPCAP